MLELPKRDFAISPGVRQQVPLWIGLYGPSGGGKTYTALRLARGIQDVQGGPVYGIDTEAKRMLHYADQFKFEHMEFCEPYGSLDYLSAIRAALAHNKTGKRPTIIIDSMSHEHEGVGGMLDVHDKTATRMATYNGEFDAKKYERVKMLAWADPKGKRRALINGMLNVEANFILCFRAKESSVPVQKTEEGSNGRTYTKTEVVNQGFVPIGGDDFIYECTLAALLMPGARGVPTWHSQLVGENRMIKLPDQFKTLPDLGQKPLDESVGTMLATWADGAEASRTANGQVKQQSAPPSGATTGNGNSREARARKWTDFAKAEISKLGSQTDMDGFMQEHDATLVALHKDFPDLRREIGRAMDDRLASL